MSDMDMFVLGRNSAETRRLNETDPPHEACHWCDNPARGEAITATDGVRLPSCGETCGFDFVAVSVVSR